ncbi:unnamed protein product [Caenorhabditis angaria]|uniref:Major sperm protein n=1 Tax=Caenorhabditis angaria TaxID=860376 RepID=A0A9P1IAF1_9PELO|nr:unnamed protein product [Caenorhabditis angaria]
MPCNTSTNYFATSDFFIFSVHLITIISTPFHIFGAFCILSRTPKLMSSAKSTLLNLHITSSILDLVYGCLACPFIMSPTISMVFFGVLGGFLDGAGIYYLVILSIALTANAMVVLFENRYHCLVNGQESKSRHRRPIFFAINIIYTFICPIPLLIFAPNQADANIYYQDQLQKYHPCILESKKSEIFVLAIDGWLLMFSFSLTSIFYVSQSIYFVTFTIWSLNRVKTSASKLTLSLQRRFMVAIVVQKAVPTVSLAIPVFFMAASIWMDSSNQAITNIFLIQVSLHGIIATLAMLIMHKPYRQAVSQCIFGCNWRFHDLSSRTSISVTHIHLKHHPPLSASKMGVELSLDPPVCPIQAMGGKSTHKMTNHTDRHIAFKIKSSNNSNYSVNQIFGIIKVCETFQLIITRKPGKPQADKLVIQYVAVGEDVNDAKAFFAGPNPPTGVFEGETVIKLSAAE